MDHVELLEESVIKLEEIKQEPEDPVPQPVWNSSELIKDSLRTEIKEDDNEELEPPVAIFLEETIKEEVEWEEEEEEHLSEEDFYVSSEGQNENSEFTGVSENIEPSNVNVKNQLWRDVLNDEVTIAEPTSQVSTSNNLPQPLRKHNCSYCLKSFQLACHLKAHIRTHTGSKPYTCPQCSACFGQQAHLHKHLRAHSGERPHQCRMCSRAFKERYQLVTHQYTHSGQWPYRCPVCNKGFAFYSRLSQHTLHKHQDGKDQNGGACATLGPFARERPAAACACGCPTSGEARACAKCCTPPPPPSPPQQQPPSPPQQPPPPPSPPPPPPAPPLDVGLACPKVLFQSPLSAHAPERPFRCAVCPKAFLTHTRLLSHARTHGEDRPFPCASCAARFTRKEHLDRHTRIHTGERPWCCGVCERSFTQKDALVKHMRLHSGEKPHLCSECGKSFSRRSSFVLHLRLHAGEKPHECTVCGKSFTRRHCLVLHLRRRSCGWCPPGRSSSLAASDRGGSE